MNPVQERLGPLVARTIVLSPYEGRYRRVKQYRAEAASDAFREVLKLCLETADQLGTPTRAEVQEAITGNRAFFEVPDHLALLVAMRGLLRDHGCGIDCQDFPEWHDFAARFGSLV
jgi:hypothetical protein